VISLQELHAELDRYESVTSGDAVAAA
jgi:hypothetical protein